MEDTYRSFVDSCYVVFMSGGCCYECEIFNMVQPLIAARKYEGVEMRKNRNWTKVA